MFTNNVKDIIMLRIHICHIRGNFQKAKFFKKSAVRDFENNTFENKAGI